jgi:hypothetical protein
MSDYKGKEITMKKMSFLIAVLGLSLLICSGTVYAAECGQDNTTTWEVIHEYGLKAAQLVDGLITTGDHPGFGYTGNIDQIFSALDSTGTPAADKQDIECLSNQISLGFSDIRWSNAEGVIGEAQNLVWLAIDNMKERKRQGESLGWTKEQVAAYITPTAEENNYAKLGAHKLFTDAGNAVFTLPVNQSAEARKGRALAMSYLGYAQNDLGGPDSVKTGPDSSYDWRLGIPAELQLISYRILVMAASHPNFAQDGWYDNELTEYRDALNKHYEYMLKGVRCRGKVYISLQPLDPTPWRCADIYTGLSAAAWDTIVPAPGTNLCVAEQTWDIFWSGRSDLNKPCNVVFDYHGTGSYRIDTTGALPQTDAEVLVDIKREVIRRMPLYGLKAMIDELYLLTHPMRDLAEQAQRIPSSAAPSLCLEVNGEQLQLWTCDGDPSQHWVYDRSRGLIGNPDIVKCLEIKRNVRASGPGFPVAIGDCVGDEWQEWTYDPETHVLLSAMGPVLTIGANAHQSDSWLAELLLELFVPRLGDPVTSSPLLLPDNQVILHPENNETAYPKQQWRADPPPLPTVVCKPTIKQTTRLVDSGSPNC